jgi:hypothetical protein
LATDLYNHWTDKPEWLPGRRLWSFYLTFAGQEALRARVADDQEVLRGIPGLNVIAPENLHLSIQGTAFSDQVEFEAVDELAELPTLSAYRAHDDFDAICMPVIPGDELAEVKGLVQTAAEKVFGAEKIHQLPVSSGGFSPHVSIAYANSFIPRSEVENALRFMSDDVTTLTVQHLSLVALRRDPLSTSWSWDYERFLPFGGSARSPGPMDPPYFFSQATPSLSRSDFLFKA